MTYLKIGRCSIGAPNDPIFIIAEIGQNHQGNLNMAKEMIDEAKKSGCNSVKFQKSCMKAKFTKAALERPYLATSSWGKTYGEHKKFLEFSIQQLKSLQSYCQKVGLIFSASAMDEVSFTQLESMNLPYIKIGSGDANNFLLLEKAAQTKSALIISTGMQNMCTIKKIVSMMDKANKHNYALLHCVSCYPTKAEDSNLLTISLLKKEFPKIIVGYSGHEVEPIISQAAVLIGAKIVERHITLNKTQKGSDHFCSLTPCEFKYLVQSIRSYEEQSLLKIPKSTEFISKYLKDNESVLKSLRRVTDKRILDCEMACRMKLGKSLVTALPIKKGTILTLKEIAVKVSDPPGLSAEYLEQYIGKRLLCDIEEDMPLQSSYLS